ncbi:hypothetical protein ACLESD_08315 [Pyxidicoccus sp. 3LFB2]
MTKNILKTALVVVSAGSLMTGCAFEQPEAGCFVQDSSNWYATYDMVEEPKLADGTSCTDVPLIGERVGVFKFVDPDNTSTPPKLTMRPDTLVALSTRDPGDSSAQTAMGTLGTEADDNDFCTATDFSVATVDAGPTPAGAARRTVSYAFSNVRVYSAPSAPGTQLTGDLTYTNNGCSSKYVVRAMWPAEPCIRGTTAPATNCGEGSGLNPDFAAECAPIDNCTTAAQRAAGYNGCCIPSKPIPSFVDAAE